MLLLRSQYEFSQLELIQFNFHFHLFFCPRLPANVSLEEGAMLEPLAVAVYACQRADVTSGFSILVCGAGPVGVLCMMVAKSAGASSVVITGMKLKTEVTGQSYSGIL